MKKLNFIIAAASAVCIMQACNNNSKTAATTDSTTTTTDATKTDTTKDTTKMASSADTGDNKFALEAASGGLTEVALGKLASQKAVSSKVKDFGQMMVTDHSQANDKLMAIAKSKNINLPATPNADDQKTIDELSKKSGADFDKAYVDDMVSDHKKDISKFKDASKNCKDANLKSFATTTLPTLQKHLDAINAIKSSM
jgi:putative membrane protein